jgi:hypothetical protein
MPARFSVAIKMSCEPPMAPMTRITRAESGHRGSFLTNALIRVIGVIRGPSSAGTDRGFSILEIDLHWRGAMRLQVHVPLT